MIQYTKEFLLEHISFIEKHAVKVDANDLAFTVFMKQKLESGDTWAEKHENLIIEISESIIADVINIINDAD